VIGWRAVFLALAALLVFVAGIGLGQALDERPDGSETQTLVRTLEPQPLLPAARTTVTVTVSKP
jgi:hypothetical protein